MRRTIWWDWEPFLEILWTIFRNRHATGFGYWKRQRETWNCVEPFCWCCCRVLIVVVSLFRVTCKARRSCRPWRMGRACRLHGHGFNSNRPNSFFALFPLDGEANSEAFRIRGDRSVVCPRNSALDIELFKEDRDVPPCNVRHHDVVCDGDRFCWISFQCFLFPKKGGSPFCFCLPRPRRRIGSSHFLLERSSLNGRIMKRGIGNVCVCVCVCVWKQIKNRTFLVFVCLPRGAGIGFIELASNLLAKKKGQHRKRASKFVSIQIP